MYCANCGAKQDSGAKFCQSCGNSLKIVEVVSDVPPQLPSSWQSSGQKSANVHSAHPHSAAVNVPWGDALTLWWSFFWRALIFGFIAGFVFGFIGGVIAALLSAPEQAVVFGMIGGYIAAIPASMLAIKQAISKNLRRLATYAQA